ncbi:MAG: acyloxyacyl hydrolase [Gammaproteobacteria bacterium]|jgi:hypothetical protein
MSRTVFNSTLWLLSLCLITTTAKAGSLYLGGALGYSPINYNSYTRPFKLKQNKFSQQLRLGYDSATNFGAEFGIIYKTNAHVTDQNNNKHEFSHNLIYLDGKYLMPISQKIALSLMAGISYVARKGVDINSTQILPTGNYAAIPNYGIGLVYHFAANWDATINLLRAAKKTNQKLPYTNSITAGVNYHLNRFFETIKKDQTQNKNKIFAGFYDKKILHASLLTHNPANSGWMIGYLHNLFTKKFLSMYAGLNLAQWKAPNSLFAASAFLEVRLWLLRTKYFNPYINGSIAGPTLINRDHVYGKDLGGYAIWQDYGGIGAEIGKNHMIDIALRVQHYSNGDFFARNPGFDVPIILTVGIKLP